MPYKINKIKGGYKVTAAGRVVAKKTSRSKAAKQVRLLRAIDHGYKPKRRKQR